jgi:hypothetical protein
MDLTLGFLNTLDFTNPPGHFNAGLCWWHSRFQRNAFYLATYSPDSPRPNESQAKEIIAKIINGDEVVEIPGFENMNSF